MILAVIVACEIGFWVAIVLGLVARYPLRRPRLGVVLLACAPALDLVLLTATALDLRGGAVATWHHGTAAIYLGFSIAYGHRMVRWADVRFAHRYADGPPPRRLVGAEHVRHCWGDVLRTTLACLVAAGVLVLLAAAAGDPDRTEALRSTGGVLVLVLGIEVVTAVSYTLWPRRAPAPAA